MNNTLKGNQDNNRYGTRPKSGASDMSTKERRWVERLSNGKKIRTH